MRLANISIWSVIALILGTTLIAAIVGCGNSVQEMAIVNFRPIPNSHPSIKQAIGSVKDNLVYFEKDGRCYAAFFYYAYGYTAFSFTQIDCKQ